MHSFKNWPVNLSNIRSASGCVAVGDCMGTAAAYPERSRQDYANNSKDAERYGNEGFNLDPPWVDGTNGEIAGYKHVPPVRSAVHPRHAGRATILWLDGHASGETPQALGYTVEAGGVFAETGDNRLWTPDRQKPPLATR